MKYDIITELEKKVVIEEHTITKELSKEQLDDLRMILSCFKMGPNSVQVGTEKEKYTSGTIKIEGDTLDYVADLSKQPYFRLSYEPTEDEIITSIKFTLNNELLKIVKKVDNGLIIIEVNNTLFKTGFQPVSTIPVIIKYYDNTALEQLRNGNYITIGMDEDLASKGIVPDKEVKYEVEKKEYKEWIYRFFNEPLNTYNSVMKYFKDNRIFGIEPSDSVKVK